eukprot:gene902-651_t
MFRRFLSGIENRKDDGESHGDDDEQEYTEDEDAENEEDDSVEALLIPSDQEKKAILASFDAMRKDSLFCDVAFVSSGVLFRCHRVVVSSWSRWMRTFLCDSPEEEILSLDIFAPDAFGAVLDYMYGYPLQVTEQKADSILKVVRRLEMHKLEQQIWRYLITILNERNCDLFHELADRYDCPPLKLAAWRLLKEKIPGLGNFPTKKVLIEAARARSHVLNGTGLIGPADPLFNTLANQFDEEELSELKLDEQTPNVKLTRVPRPPVPPPVPSSQSHGGDDALHTTLNTSVNPNGPLISRPPTSAAQSRTQPARNAANQSPMSKTPGGGEPKEVRTKMVKGVKTVDWEAELTDFYDAVGAPQKIPGIPAILKAWEGKEERMIQNLMKKYEGNIPKKMLVQLERKSVSSASQSTVFTPFTILVRTSFGSPPPGVFDIGLWFAAFRAGCVRDCAALVGGRLISGPLGLTLVFSVVCKASSPP